MACVFPALLQAAKHLYVCRQVGIPAVVLERDAGLRLEGSAIALWSNAFRALEAVGVAQPLLDDHPPLRRCHLKRHSYWSRSEGH